MIIYFVFLKCRRRNPDIYLRQQRRRISCSEALASHRELKLSQQRFLTSYLRRQQPKKRFPYNILNLVKAFDDVCTHNMFSLSTSSFCFWNGVFISLDAWKLLFMRQCEPDGQRRGVIMPLLHRGRELDRS